MRTSRRWHDNESRRRSCSSGPAIARSDGYARPCAVRTDNTVACWGDVYLLNPQNDAQVCNVNDTCTPMAVAAFQREGDRQARLRLLRSSGSEPPETPDPHDIHRHATRDATNVFPSESLPCNVRTYDDASRDHQRPSLKLAHEHPSKRVARPNRSKTAAGHVARRGPGRPPKTQPTKVHAATTTVKRGREHGFALQPKTSRKPRQGRLGFEDKSGLPLGAIAENPSPREGGRE